MDPFYVYERKNSEDQVSEKVEWRQPVLLLSLFLYICRLNLKKSLNEEKVFIIMVYDRTMYFGAQNVPQINNFCKIWGLFNKKKKHSITLIPP